MAVLRESEGKREKDKGTHSKREKEERDTGGKKGIKGTDRRRGIEKVNL
jgi:hypothetical protein